MDLDVQNLLDFPCMDDRRHFKKDPDMDHVVYESGTEGSVLKLAVLWFDASNAGLYGPAVLVLKLQHDPRYSSGAACRRASSQTRF